MQTTEIKTDKFCYADRRKLGQTAIDEEFIGIRIDQYLAKCFPFFTRAAWQKRINRGELFVNELASRRASYRLQKGDHISMHYPRNFEPRVETHLPVLFKVHGVMAINKPAGLPMHENGPYLRNTFANALVEQHGAEWSAIHRLDRETSGVVLCSESHDLRARLAGDLAKKQMQKSYIAIVEGRIEEDEFSELAPLGDPPQGSEIRIKKWVNHRTGLPSHTDFSVIDRCATHTLVRAFPRTGRTNQIRIHLAWNGHRILGDKLYHPDERVFLSYYDKVRKDWVDKMAGYTRLCLHAERLEFFHPILETTCIAECPLPQELSSLWSHLKLGTNLP